MKRTSDERKDLFAGSVIVLLFGAMLFSPRAVFSGAESGLLLWFRTVFPTLFPFMLISNLLLRGGGLSVISRIFGRPFSGIFAVSGNGSMAVLAGFLCGYPMGAKVTADLLRGGRISKEEGAYLLSFCNNTSPVFLMNFVVWKTLGKSELTAPALLIMTIPPVALSFLFRRIYLGRGKRRFPDGDAGKTFPKRRESEGSDRRTDRETGASGGLFDTCMMDAFEGIVKVGGYIIFFSILTELAEQIPWESPAVSVLLPLLEMTNGIRLLHRKIPDLSAGFPLILGLCSFGGLCAAAQTRCMLRGTGLKTLPYIIEKLAAAAAASLMAFLYMQLHGPV